MAGAPPGNRNAAKGKVWSDTIRKAVAQYESQKQNVKRGEALFRIATKMVEAAIDGDKDAVKEIGERLDGKATQHINAEFNILDRLSESGQLAFLAALESLEAGPDDPADGVTATH